MFFRGERLKYLEKAADQSPSSPPQGLISRAFQLNPFPPVLSRGPGIPLGPCLLLPSQGLLPERAHSGTEVAGRRVWELQPLEPWSPAQGVHPGAGDGWVGTRRCLETWGHTGSTHAHALYFKLENTCSLLCFVFPP